MSCCFSAGMPMPVSDTVKAMTVSAWSSRGAGRVHPLRAGAIPSRTEPFSVNLKALERRFFSTCSRRRRSGLHQGGQLFVELDRKVEMLRLGDVAEIFLHVFPDFGERRLMRLDLRRARFDPREVEDLVDEFQQVVARGIDRPGVLDLLLAQVGLPVVGENLGQDEQAVERRAQLVRHAGEEVGLVLRGEGDLLGLLLDLLARRLDLPVGPLHLLLLQGEEGDLFLHLLVRLLQLLVGLLEFLVGLLQLLLLFLQLQLGDAEPAGLGLELDVLDAQLVLTDPQVLGQGLGLPEQFLRPDRALDGVEDDADAVRQPVEEGELDGGGPTEQGQLQHRLHLALEQGGLDDDGLGRRPAEGRIDVEIIGRDFLEHDPLLVQETLAGQPFARLDFRRRLVHRVARLEFQPSLGRAPFRDVEDRVARLQQRGQLGQDGAADEIGIAPPLKRAVKRARLVLSQSCSDWARWRSSICAAMRLKREARRPTSSLDRTATRCP